MLKNQKRKQIAFIMALISLGIIIAIFYFSILNAHKNKAIAEVNDVKIYESDVKDELIEMFPKANPESFQVNALPENVLEMLVKGIYIKKRIYNDATHHMVHKNEEVKKDIERYSKRVTREYYLDLTVRKKITKEALQTKYLEIADQNKEEGKDDKLADFEEIEGQLVTAVRDDEIKKIFVQMYQEAHVKILVKK